LITELKQKAIIKG